MQKSLEKRFLGETSYHFLGKNLLGQAIRVAMVKTHQMTGKSNGNWQVDRTDVTSKMSTKETWLQSPVTDAVNLFSENVNVKNVESRV